MKNWLRATAAFAGVAALTLGSAVTATAANSVDEGSNVKTFRSNGTTPSWKAPKLTCFYTVKSTNSKTVRKQVPGLVTSGQCSNSLLAKMKKFPLK